MEQYTTLLEKDRYFNATRINSNEELDKFILKKKFDGNSIFRGVKNSSYRMYNSLQREIFDKSVKEKYLDEQEFLNDYITKAKELHQDIFEKYFKAINFYPVADIAILSFLQHHGAPTPLLDWTKSFNTALFFASDGINDFTTNSNLSDCNNYITIYQIDEEKLRGNILEYELYKELEKSYERFVDNIHKHNPDEDITTIDEWIVQHFAELYFNDTYRNDYLSIKYLVNKRICYLNDFSKLNTYKLYTLNSFNIVNQSGGFLFNYHLDYPLERLLKELYNETVIKSYEIHKTLLPKIRRYLDNSNVNNNNIYPNPYAIAKEIGDSFTSELPKKIKDNIVFNSIGVIKAEWRCRYCRFDGDFEQEYSETKVSPIIKCPKCGRCSDIGTGERVTGWFDKYSLLISSYNKVPVKVKIGTQEIILDKYKFTEVICSGDDLIWMINPENGEYYASKSIFSLKDNSAKLSLNISDNFKHEY